MNGVADQLMPAISKSSSLREIYLGENPWQEQEWKTIINVYQKPSQLNVLGLGIHTYLIEDCVKVPNFTTYVKFRLYNISIPVDQQGVESKPWA